MCELSDSFRSHYSLGSTCSRKAFCPALLRTQKLHLTGLYVDRHLTTEKDHALSPPSAAQGWPQSLGRCQLLAPLIYQQLRFAAGRGLGRFGGFISRFSIVNQLFVNVTWVLGIRTGV